MAGHQEQEQEDVDGEEEFTFPTPPQPHVLFGKDLHHHPAFSASASSSPPAWLLSSPIRRSFSAADCAASPWHVARRQNLLHGGACCSPALSDYDAAAGFCFDDDAEGEEEERMDSLWEDLNDHDAAAAAARGNDGLLFLGSSLDVSRRRSIAGERVTKAANKDPGAQAALGASRSSRRRPPGLVVMMRALKRMFVAHKGKSRVHRDEQSIASASASSYSFSSSNNPSKSKKG